MQAVADERILAIGVRTHRLVIEHMKRHFCVFIRMYLNGSSHETGVHPIYLRRSSRAPFDVQ